MELDRLFRQTAQQPKIAACEAILDPDISAVNPA
jgi:hypothetical protein